MATELLPAETLITFEGATSRLRGKVLVPDGESKGALVAAHGRHGDMDEPLVAAVARLGADLGLWSLRFNFAYQDAGAEASAGHEEEIADLREAIAYARRTSKQDHVVVAGRGLGAWAAIAAATDDDPEDLILLGLSYTAQAERKMVLQRLGEFEIDALIFVGSKSDRLDLAALHEVVRKIPTVQFVIVDGANHPLQDERHEPMTDVVLTRCERWLRERFR
ncbi:MAG: alpha/beta family hydrolase [Methanobacteriota archaeon]